MLHCIMTHSSHFFSFCSACHFQGPTLKQFYSPLVSFLSSLLSFPIDTVTVNLEIFFFFATQECICNIVFKGFYNSNHLLHPPSLPATFLLCKTFLKCSKRKKCNLQPLSHVVLCINFQAALLGGIHFSSKMAERMPLGSDFAFFS